CALDSTLTSGYGLNSW
nr:immunoglobulin heavy chain junction region [Macaca mulatta]